MCARRISDSVCMHRNHPPSPPFLLSIKQRSAIYAPSLPSMEREQGWFSSSFQEPLPARREVFSFFVDRFRYISLHFERNRYRYIFKYTCIRKFLYVYSIFDECKLAVIIHDDERGKERKEERERKNPILLKSHRSIENQVSENLLLSSRTTDALSDPRRVEIHFPPRGSHFFSPFLPLVNPFSPLSPRFRPLNAAPISLTRIIARKIRNGAELCLAAMQ